VAKLAGLPADQRLVPSMLDRLIDPDSQGTVAQPGYGPQELFEAVRRDLQDLLNTRRPLAGPLDPYPDLKTSLLTYGLPDLTNLNVTSAVNAAEVARVVEWTLARFEPRLRDVQVDLIAPATHLSWTVRLQVRGRLVVSGYPEVSYDVTLGPRDGKVVVK
jgi:type VI secretion system protein ImpF